MPQFTKMTGAGNDFIVIDNRGSVFSEAELPELAKALCPRGTSVGADGILFLENDSRADFRMRIINADGSEAEMCGNGARCMAVYISENSLAGPLFKLNTLAGIINAEITDSGAKVQLTDTALPDEKHISVGGEERTIYLLDTGVPHAIMMTEEVNSIPIIELGSSIRHHESFMPAGVNADFIANTGENQISIRTYERGVEGETLACGTGATAGALAAASVWQMESPIKVLTRSGIELTISFEAGDEFFTGIHLEGPAWTVYRGEW